MADKIRDKMADYVIGLSAVKGRGYALAVVEVANLRFHVQYLKFTGRHEESLRLAIEYRDSVAMHLHTLGVTLAELDLQKFFTDCEGLLDIYITGSLQEQKEVFDDPKVVNVDEAKEELDRIMKM